MKASLSKVMLTNHITRLANGGDTRPRNPNIAMRNPIPIISPFAIDGYSPPLSLLDEFKPFVVAKLQVNVSFLSWSHAKRIMYSNEIIVQHKSICHILSCLRIMQASHDFGSLLQCVMPSLNRHVLHAFLDWRNSEVNRLWIWPVHDFLFESCVVSLQRVANHDCRQTFCLFLTFFENHTSIRNESALVNLRGNDESSIVIHQIPKPVKVTPAVHSAGTHVYYCFINVPDTANIWSKLGNVCFHDLNVSLYPIVNGRLPDLDTIELHQMVADLAIRHTLEVQIHAKGNDLGILLHALKALSVAELVMADEAGQTLNLAKLGVSIAIFFVLDALAFWTAKSIVLFLIENWIANLYLLSHLQRELNTVNVFTSSMTVNMIRASASPCQTVSMNVIVMFRSLRAYLVVSRIDSLEHVFVLGDLESLLLTFRKGLTHSIGYAMYYINIA